MRLALANSISLTARNINRWNREQLEFYRIEKIPDEYLPVNVFEAEGGAKRRRRSVMSI